MFDFNAIRHTYEQIQSCHEQIILDLKRQNMKLQIKLDKPCVCNEFGSIPTERPSGKGPSIHNLQITTEEKIRILNRSEIQAKMILMSMENEHDLNIQQIKDYIDMISYKKEVFINQMDDECDADISDDNADSRSNNSVSASLIQLNEKTRQVNKLTDLKAYQVTNDQIILNQNLNMLKSQLQKQNE